MRVIDYEQNENIMYVLIATYYVQINLMNSFLVWEG